MVAMNAQTYASRHSEVRTGGYMLYDSSWPLDSGPLRDDVTFLGVPSPAMCNESFRDSRERILMKNIAYAGALIAFLEHRYGRCRAGTPPKRSIASKKAIRESNRTRLNWGTITSARTSNAPLPFHLETMEATRTRS